jgi:uncharacterized protein YecE (DUF72 family)
LRRPQALRRVGYSGGFARAPLEPAIDTVAKPASRSGNHHQHVRIGIGGWTFAPWRNNFYPLGLPHSEELHWASRQLNAIEVNGTYYRTFKPSTFAQWHDETPDGFMFSVKAHRSATQPRVLAGAGDSIARFVNSGIAELRTKLGPIVWQFPPHKVFDPIDFEAFLALLPRELEGQRLRHALDARHTSFATPVFIALARRYGCVPVCTDSDAFPAISDAEAGFAYLRLMRSQAGVATGYPPEAIWQWAQGVRAWTGGDRRRDVFLYVINGAKERAPAGALALMAELGLSVDGEGPGTT